MYIHIRWPQQFVFYLDLDSKGFPATLLILASGGVITQEFNQWQRDMKESDIASPDDI